ncbi:MAG: hypothetical protein NC349_08065 [Paenibacillus sp.]|nr:hypothetical protein [Paenibacillus sp.]
MRRFINIAAIVVAMIAMAAPVADAQRHHGANGNNSRTERPRQSAVRPSSGHSRGEATPGHNTRPSVGQGNGNHGNNRPGNNQGVRPGNNRPQRPEGGNSGRPTVGNSNRPSVGQGNGNHGNNRPGNSQGVRPGNNRPQRPEGGNSGRPNVGNSGRPNVGGSSHPGVGNNRPGNHPGVSNRPGQDHRPGVGDHPVPGPSFGHGPVARPPRPAVVRPPHRPYRPVMSRPHYRPVPPPAWRPRRGIPVIGGVLGLTFGIAFNASLDYLYNSGYVVDGYGNNIVYLRNVPAMNYVWTDAALYYGNGGLDASSFYYSTPGYDMSRYNSVYSHLVNVYGMPVSTGNSGGVMTSTWFGGNRGYITLTFGAGDAGRFLTTLTLGM